MTPLPSVNSGVRGCVTYVNDSVFHADQHGMGPFPDQPLKAKGGLERPDLALPLCSDESSEHEGLLFPYSCLFMHKAVARNMYRSICKYFFDIWISRLSSGGIPMWDPNISKARDRF